MKKLALTIAVVIGLSLTTFANNDGGLFQRGASVPTYGLYGDRTESLYGLPTAPEFPDHNQEGNQPAPLGSGIAVMIGLGAAYMVAKKRKED